MTKRLLVMIICIAMLCTLIGCGGSRSMSITFDKISRAELDRTDLEVKDDSKVAFVESNTSLYKIVLDESSSVSLKRSVDDLVSTLSTMSNVTLDIMNVAIDDGSHYIYIDSKSDAILDGVVEDGFVIDIGDNIHIKGNDTKASRNGVYHFIEHYLGAVFISNDDTYVPHHDNIYLTRERKIFNPKTAWRDIYAYESVADSWAGKLKLNAIDIDTLDSEIVFDTEGMTDADIVKRRNELRQYDEWGTWCHSMYRFVPPEEYYATHPEYYSLKDGKRVHTYQNIDAHLCLSNEEVYNIVEKRLGEMIAEHPEVKYWDFSINDNSWVAGCECDNCRALDEAHGGTGMGSLLPFINRLARKYPDKYICTLAYFHTLKPPTDIKCEKNVVVKLCSMPGDQASSYYNPTNHNAKVFNDRVEAWSKICDHIVIWDYVVNFSNLLMPFPNMAVQRENQLFYENNNIEGIFHQASREKGGEMSHMRTYILSKLMWEGSSMDMAHEVSKYVYAYYGDAAPLIIDYLNALHEEVATHSSNLGLYDSIVSHDSGYLSHDNLRYYSTLLSDAKSRVGSDQKYIDRIEMLELNVKYAELIHPETPKREREVAHNTFKTLCAKHDITMVREWQSVADFDLHIDDEIMNVKIEKSKPLFISLGVTLGVIAVFGTLLIVLKVKRGKKDNK